jgi:hypothetical protein
LILAGFSCPTLGQQTQATAAAALADERFLRLDELERMALEKNATVAQAEAILRSVLGRAHQARLYPHVVDRLKT